MAETKAKVTIIRHRFIKAASRSILPRHLTKKEKGQIIEQILTKDHETFRLLAKK